MPIESVTQPGFPAGEVLLMQEGSETNAAALAVAASDEALSSGGPFLQLEGFFLDSIRRMSQVNAPIVTSIVKQAGADNDVDVYSTFDQSSVAWSERIAGMAELSGAFRASIEAAAIANEQLAVVSGGPADFAVLAVREWYLDDTTALSTAKKTAWLMNGGFVQVTHGAYLERGGYGGPLDAVRTPDPDDEVFNAPPNLVSLFAEFYGDVRDEALAAFGGGWVATAEARTGGESFLWVLENQNANAAVRGDPAEILPTIGYDFARQNAATYSKLDGTLIDISDLGVLGVFMPFGINWTLDDTRAYVSEPGTPPDPADPPAAAAIGTSYGFEGVRFWLAQDISSDLDDPASTAALIRGGQAVAISSVPGSSDNTLTVRAGGTGTAAVPPQFEVLVDGVSLGVRSITSPIAPPFAINKDANYQDYGFTFAGPAPDTVQIRYLNDGTSGGINRDLFVDYIKLNGTTYESEVDGFFQPNNPNSPLGGPRQSLYVNGVLTFDELSDPEFLI
jgi:hypothetical protein